MTEVRRRLETLPAVAGVDVQWYPTPEARVELEPGADPSWKELAWAVRRAGFVATRIEETTEAGQTKDEASTAE